MAKIEELKIKLDNAYAASNAAYEEMQLAWGVLRTDDISGEAYDDWYSAKSEWGDAYDLCSELQSEYDKELEE